MERVRFDDDRCKGCGICVRFCPAGIIRLSDRPNRLGYRPAGVSAQEGCTSCALCALMCPDGVIEVVRPRRSGRREAGAALV